MSESGGDISSWIQKNKAASVALVVVAVALIYGVNNNIAASRQQVKMTPQAIQAQQELDARQQAQQEAAQKAWEASKAGQICADHPSWVRSDCDKLAEGKIWIGMSADMLVFERGKADHVNKSNYGNGDEYQACWDDYTPSCFYDNNNDGRVDAYN